MDELLMLHGVARWCSDCAAETIFVPVLEGDTCPAAAESELGTCLCCTACSAAVLVSVAA